MADGCGRLVLHSLAGVLQYRLRRTIEISWFRGTFARSTHANFDHYLLFISDVNKYLVSSLLWHPQISAVFRIAPKLCIGEGIILKIAVKGSHIFSE